MPSDPAVAERIREELVVLLDDDGLPSGTARKDTVHDTETPLHLAFSCHVFDGRGRVLITRRALDKRTWPGVWTNSFCGHPAPGEPIEDAVARRAADELGLALDPAALELALPEFRYRAVDASGVVEHELCPVYVARADAEPLPNPAEVVEHRWVDPAALGVAVRALPEVFSPWLVLQVAELPAFADAVGAVGASGGADARGSSGASGGMGR